MSWSLLIGVVLTLGLALAALLWRRVDLARLEAGLAERRDAVARGTHEARLAHPVIDLSRCLGCATCIDVCPEDDVLQLLHGQAAVVNGARCAGVGACARECPVGAVSLQLADLDQRRDIPVLDEGLESPQRPGLFLAGEVTAHALIKTAVEHGTRVAAEVARRVRGPGSIVPERRRAEQLDLCIVGAGPAGLACALEATRHGLRFAFLDQEDEAGGTVARYPRRKLVLTQPVDLPLHGRLGKSSYLKEELVELWQGLVRQHQLPLRGGRRLEGLERDPRGGFVVRTQHELIPAANVCLALGRRGTPVKLGVPGEELPKVAYALLDAQSYQGRRVLVVGGGDSAVETALALAEQPGNEVTLAYRRESFGRIRSRNAARLQNAEAAGALHVLRCTELRAITPHDVQLVQVDAQSGAEQPLTLPNDEVFVMAGGVAPFGLLERAGVSFDPAQRPKVETPGEQGTGLLRAVGLAFVLALAALAWALWHSDYYLLEAAERPAHFKHQLLRPGRALGLDLGLLSIGLVLLNLAYLLRRANVRGFRFGTLAAWMTGHVATGVLALLCALLHAGMAPRDTVGGHAFLAMAALLVTGAVGRYVYAWVPRAANGRELQLDELRDELQRVGQRFEGEHAEFARDARRELLELMHRRQWRGSFVGRVVAFFGVQLDLWRVQRALRARGRAAGVPDTELRGVLLLARRAHRSALVAAHVEDLRALLAAWRYLHRWGGALMLLLIVLHVLYALTYGEHTFVPSREPLL